MCSVHVLEPQNKLLDPPSQKHIPSLPAPQVMNLMFFLGTVHYLVDHWRKAAGIIKSELKANFLIVLKLFFIMGERGQEEANPSPTHLAVVEIPSLL